MERNPTQSTTNPLLQSHNQPNIGLVGDRRFPIVEILNTIMADEFVLTMKTQCAYWNVNGLIFQDLRNLFYQQLMELHTVVDAIAERVRGLDSFAISSFEDFLNYTRLEEHPGEVPTLMNFLSDHEASIRHLHNDAQLCIEKYGDHDTYDVIVHFIELHEQMVRSLRSYIEPEITPEESQGAFMSNRL